MNFENKTKNQHYIAQVEQKLNSINPDAERDKRRIYKLKVKDRGNSIVKSTDKNGVEIERNLSYKDLYTFNFLENGIRENFENFFQKYENDIETQIKNMQNKCNDGYQDITLEVVNIFLYKLMNIIRNPYFIKETIVIFEGLLNKSLSNTDSVYSNSIQKIINSRLENKEQIYRDYSVSAEDYKKWLVIIYILIGEHDEEKCKLVDIIKNVFNDQLTSKKISVSIHNDGKYCLLSDRGFNLKADDSGIYSFDFNLSKNIFFSFIRFDDLRSGSIVQEMRENGANENNIDEIFDYIENNNKLNLFDASIKAGLIENDDELLIAYNQRTIQNCHEHVFGASTEYEGVTVLP